MEILFWFLKTKVNTLHLLHFRSNVVNCSQHLYLTALFLLEVLLFEEIYRIRIISCMYIFARFHTLILFKYGVCGYEYIFINRALSETGFPSNIRNLIVYISKPELYVLIDSRSQTKFR